MNNSYAGYFLSLPIQERARRLEILAPNERAALLYDWQFWRRPNQAPPAGAWRVWLILAGRGFGKTRVGAEMVREWARRYRYVNLIGATADDARDIMIMGESGILAVCPKAERPRYIQNAARLEWPSGCQSLIFTAAEPERLRGKQHEKLWADELGAWRYPDAWDQALMGLRLGDNPQAVITTTPRPTPIIKGLMTHPNTRTTRGSTYDNRDNLAPSFFEEIIKRYEGTRLGRQELNAEILDDNPNALWRRGDIDKGRLTKVPDLARVVVGVDPSITATGDEAGIVTAGRAGDEYYTIADDSTQGTPLEWARAAVTAYHRHKANRIIAESNQGGEMVAAVIRQVDASVPVKLVHASRGKQVRAEPVAALCEQGRDHHVGMFPALEDELCEWEPGMDSPNRMDAKVWAYTDLMNKSGQTTMAEDPFAGW